MARASKTATTPLPISENSSHSLKSLSFINVQQVIDPCPFLSKRTAGDFLIFIHCTINVTKSTQAVLSAFSVLCHPNHLLLAGANSGNVIITLQFHSAPVQANRRDFFWHIHTQEPITRSEQLPNLAYVKAFLRTSLFLDTFQGTFSPRN